LEQAQEEAKVIRAKLESGEAIDYAEADKIVEIEKFRAESPYFDELLKNENELEDGYEIIDTPTSRSGGYHFVMETKSGRKFVEKYPEKNEDEDFKKNHETMDFINEYFESNLIKYAISIGILDGNKFDVPSIKLDPEEDGAYFSEFFPNIINGLKGGDVLNAMAVINNLPKEAIDKLPMDQYAHFKKQYSKYLDIFWKELTKKENAIPLALIHLVAGDFDRNMSNYGFQISKSADEIDFKIVILDMAGGWGENRQWKGRIGNVLLKNFSKDEIMQQWEKIKSYITEGIVEKIVKQIPFDDELKSKKRDEVLNNIKNMEKLVEEELAAVEA